MPRGPRKISGTGIYHVMERGNQKNNIFFDNEDRFKFIEILRDRKSEMKFYIYGYCLMDNHVHILIDEGDESISSIMKSINISYVYYFNKKYDRVGHLFQDRFKSEVVNDDAYLVSVVRYIHQNPIKAGIVPKINGYQWSSYGDYVNSLKRKPYLTDVDTMLEIFSPQRNKAVNLFIDFNNQLSGDHYLDIIDNDTERDGMINRIIDAEEYIKKRCQENNIAVEDLAYQKAKEGSLLYEMVIYLKENSALNCTEIGNILGISRSTVSRTK